MHRNNEYRLPRLPIPPTRRRFLETASLSLAALTVARGQNPAPNPQLDAQLVERIVRAAHRDRSAVQDLLEKQPKLANGVWDWGNGDFETPLGAASHMGRSDIASILINQGARPDLFHYAAHGNLAVIRAAVDADPRVATIPGPHRLSLLFHAAIGANVDLATHLLKNGAVLDDGVLAAAVLLGKSYEMTEWLLDNGSRYYGQSHFSDEPLAATARKQGLERIAALLEKRLAP